MVPALQEPLALPAIRDLLVHRAQLVLPETQALQEVLVQPDRQEVQVQRVLLVILDLLVLLVPLVLLAVLVLLGRLERRVLTRPSLDQLVQQVRRERQGLLAQQDPLVRQDLQERLDLLERLVQQERLVRLVVQDRQDHKAI